MLLSAHLFIRSYFLVWDPSTKKGKTENEYTPGLPDYLNKLAKFFTMLFVFLCICLVLFS